ncbi:MAG: ATPase [Gammaproteobacteria bacterium]|nr:MAG: ATPase [Gammaproteobacteria bacterium]
MYESLYSFSGKPFQLTPDPRFFYRSRNHQRALAYMRYGIQQGQGFIVITGDVGTGKSTLVGILFRELEKQNLTAAKIVSTNIKETDLLRMVAAGFGLPFERATKATLLKRLEEHFKACRDEGRRVLLVVDECQNIPARSLEELRMLSNFEYQGEPLLQTFLLGQREFRSTMRSKGFEQLRQRVIAAYHLKPLDATETRRYIEHRLKKVGWVDDPHIEDEVFAGIHRFTDGVPRRINTLCDRLLLNASLDEKHVITTEELETVSSEIELEYGEPAEDEPLQAREVRAAGGAAAAATPAPEVEKLEQRLVAMQNAVESLSRSVAAQVMAQQQGYYARQERRGLSPWAIALGVLGALLLAGGVGAFLLLRS